MRKAKIRLLIEVLAALAFGLLVNATLLRDADTWWLLGLGRWIANHHCLPTADPFSYTMAFQSGRAYLPHQWLSALVFYYVYSFGTIIGLLSMTVGVLFGAFVLLPMAMLKKAAPLWLAVALTVLGVWSARFHFLTRPEIFSYLFEALLLTCLAKHRIKLQITDLAQNSKIDFRFVASIFVIFVLSCNFHSGFVIEAIVVAAYAGSSLIIALLNKNKLLIDRSALVSACSLLIAVLVNPFGIGLLIYLKNQLWFDPFLNSIGEMRPTGFVTPSFYPFYGFVFVFVALLLMTLKKARAAKQSAYFLISTVCVAFVPTCTAFEHCRLILFAVLVMLFELAIVLNRWRSFADVPEKEAIMPSPPNLKLRFVSQALPVMASLLSVPLAFILFGVDNRWDVRALTIVDKGVEYVAKHAHGRRIFNDIVLGDRIIWLSPEHPLVFIDTRYDMYGQSLVDEYDLLSMGRPGWEKILEKYKIEMVCFYKQSRIAELLAQEPRWKPVYSDARVIVYERLPGR